MAAETDTVQDIDQALTLLAFDQRRISDPERWARGMWTTSSTSASNWNRRPEVVRRLLTLFATAGLASACVTGPLVLTGAIVAELWHTRTRLRLP